MLPQTKNHPERLATRRDLEKISFATLQLAGTGNLSPLGRRWLCFFVVLARLGYLGIHAPVWSIVSAQYRAQGQTKSESTFYRAARQLEQAGYIRRQKYRIGPDRFGVKIYFKMDRFTYWLREKAHVHSVTCDYIAAQLSNCEQTEVTNQGSCVNSLNSSNLVVNVPRAREQSNKEHFKKTKMGKEQGDRERRTREHPIVYSIRRATMQMDSKRRAVLIALAKREAENPKRRRSGAPWGKWDRRNQQTGRIAFEELSIPHEREYVARSEFLPYLESMAGLEKIEPVVKAAVERRLKPDMSPGAIDEAQKRERINRETLNPTPIDENAPSASDIRAWLKDTPLDSCQSGAPGLASQSPEEVSAMIKGAGLAPALTGEPERPQGDRLNPDELDILRNAKARAAGRVADLKTAPPIGYR